MFIQKFQAFLYGIYYETITVTVSTGFWDPGYLIDYKLRGFPDGDYASSQSRDGLYVCLYLMISYDYYRNIFILGMAQIAYARMHQQWMILYAVQSTSCSA